jgi:hypothetical protein
LPFLGLLGGLIVWPRYPSKSLGEFAGVFWGILAIWSARAIAMPSYFDATHSATYSCVGIVCDSWTKQLLVWGGPCWICRAPQVRNLSRTASPDLVCVSSGMFSGMVFQPLRSTWVSVRYCLLCPQGVIHRCLQGTSTEKLVSTRHFGRD